MQLPGFVLAQNMYLKYSISPTTDARQYMVHHIVNSTSGGSTPYVTLPTLRSDIGSLLRMAGLSSTKILEYPS